MLRAIFSRARCYFVVFPFILQSKEYPRNVPGNPTRKCVEKEVCKTNEQQQTEQKEDLNEKERGEGSVHPSKAANVISYQLPNQSANWEEHGTCESDRP